MTIEVVRPGDFDNGFEVNALAADGISLNVQASLVQDGTGAWGVDVAALNLLDPVAGNLLTQNAAGEILFNQAALQSAETVWTATSPDSVITVTPGGTNGHAVSFQLNPTAPAFVEAVQDAVGQAILAGTGITYDDVSDSISAALGNLTFGNGLNNPATNGGTLEVLPDPASPATVSVSAAGVSVDASAQATIELCGLDGVAFAKAFPT